MLTTLPFLSPRRPFIALDSLEAPARSTSTERVLCLGRREGVGHAVGDFSRACLIRLIEFPELPLRNNTVETIKAGGTALLIKTEFPVGNQMISVAYKRVRRRNWFKQLTSLFRTNRLLRTWRMGHRFRELGVPTPRPLAVIYPRWFQWSRESYLAVEWIDGAENLLSFVRHLGSLKPQRERQLGRATARQVGEMLGRMHASRISHRDLKASNLLVRYSAGQDVETWIIDLDGSEEHHRELAQSQCVRNLSRLEAHLRRFPSLTRALRLRFLRAYLAERGIDADGWKNWWRDAAAASDERLAQL